MTKRVFEGVKRFKSQKWMGAHSGGRRRFDLVDKMNAEGIPPLPPEILEQTQKLKSLRKKPPSAVAKGITAALKATSDRLAAGKKPKAKARKKKKFKPRPKPKRQ